MPMVSGSNPLAATFLFLSLFYALDEYSLKFT